MPFDTRIVFAYTLAHGVVCHLIRELFSRIESTLVHAPVVRQLFSRTNRTCSSVRLYADCFRVHSAHVLVRIQYAKTIRVKKTGTLVLGADVRVKLAHNCTHSIHVIRQSLHSLVSEHLVLHLYHRSTKFWNFLVLLFHDMDLQFTLDLHS